MNDWVYHADWNIRDNLGKMSYKHKLRNQIWATFFTVYIPGLNIMWGTEFFMTGDTEEEAGEHLPRIL